MPATSMNFSWESARAGLLPLLKLPPTLHAWQYMLLLLLLLHTPQ